MAVQQTTMTYEVSEIETRVKYVICHDTDAEFVFRVTVEPIGVDVRITSIREEYLDSVCTIILVSYDTSTGVQVSLTWI